MCLCGGSGHGHAWDMSPSGDTVVGLAWDECVPRAFRWTEDEGFAALGLVGEGNNRASAVSNDGSIVAGFADAGAFFARSPTTWAGDGSGEFIDTDVGEVRAMNGSGTVMTGEFNYGDAFVWSEQTGLVNIGRIPAGDPYYASGLGVCAEGELIVGITGVTGPIASDAFVWTEARGMELLHGRLIDLGVELPDNIDHLYSVLDCSEDGTRLVGAAVIAGVGYQAYVLTLPEQWWAAP